MPDTTCERCGEGFSAAARRGYCDTCVSHYDGARRANADALEPCVYRREGQLVAVVNHSGYVLNALHVVEAAAGSLHPAGLPMSAERIAAYFRCFAAAPALLEACKALLERVDTWGDLSDGEIAAVRRAVALATGPDEPPPF